MAILVKNEMETFELAENILEIMRRSWGEEEKFPMISVSMGMATFPIDSLEIQRVIQIADRGLYRAKELGGNQYMLERAMF
ncbi:GGDEF domain-containing protein [Alicyclobacillus tengchongensis]|uniref:GGDEF domain-containing protein n=1 Tax=Alicyclobacillus tolerans TaxID=90970 RepID=A0ABT9LZ32_9BACL|nr:GGDEF domain-containing protein [Alicyclobacillus tengchongensis]